MKLKEMIEKHAALLAGLADIVGKADAEVRAMTGDEQKAFEAKEAEVLAMGRTIEAMKRAATYAAAPDAAMPDAAGSAAGDGPELRAAKEDEAKFAEFLRGSLAEERAGANFNLADNTAVVPAAIANRIIDRVREICPVLAMSEIYNVGGELQIPLYDDTASDVRMAFTEEFEELTSTAGKFRSISLKGYLAGSLTKIGRRLLNNAQFNLTNFIIEKMAANISRFIEGVLLHGSDGRVDGLRGVTQVVTAASGAVITADDLVDLQDKIIDAFQPDAVWIMNRETRSAIRKLKDADGNFILNRDMTTAWNHVLLGKPVYTSDNMPAVGSAGGAVIYYGDMKGLAVKLTEEVNIEVLREKFATQHAVGVVGWMELDAKVQNTQMIAALKMAAPAGGQG